jgi:hypothetical protein
MRILRAVSWGFVVATALNLAGRWAATSLVASAFEEFYASTFAAGLIALFHTAVSITIGAYVATRIHDANETISGFIIAQAFFGFGLIREFWSVGSSWYTATAVLLVIPCAIIGQILARLRGRKKLAGHVAMSRLSLVAALALLPALSLRAQVPDPGMVGAWSGDGQIVVNWTDQSFIHVRLDILADGSVTGTVGDARLTAGRISRNRGPIGRLLNIKTDYIVRGELRGPVIASEHIERDRVNLPLNWDGRTFRGGLHTSGSAFGGADRMVLTAFHLELTRTPATSGRLPAR